jgi:hypothetical protein
MSDDIKRTDYPNGSYEVKHKRTCIGYIVAPNPFGTTWTMNFNGEKLFGRGFSEYISRRGKKWRLHFEDGVGWNWR